MKLGELSIQMRFFIILVVIPDTAHRLKIQVCIIVTITALFVFIGLPMITSISFMTIRIVSNRIGILRHNCICIGFGVGLCSLCYLCRCARLYRLPSCCLTLLCTRLAALRHLPFSLLTVRYELAALCLTQRTPPKPRLNRPLTSFIVGELLQLEERDEGTASIQALPVLFLQRHLVNFHFPRPVHVQFLRSKLQVSVHIVVLRMVLRSHCQLQHMSMSLWIQKMVTVTQGLEIFVPKHLQPRIMPCREVCVSHVKIKRLVHKVIGPTILIHILCIRLMEILAVFLRHFKPRQAGSEGKDKHLVLQK